VKCRNDSKHDTHFKVVDKLGLAPGSEASHPAALVVPLAGVGRFQLCLLARRDKVLVFLVVLDDLFGHHLALEPAQGTFDGLVVVN